MRRNALFTLALAGVCLAGGIGAQCAPGNGSSDLRVALVATGVDPNASGQVWSLLSGIVAQIARGATLLFSRTFPQ